VNDLGVNHIICLSVQSCKVKILFGELLLAALELVSTCSCTSDAGCPNCIQVSSNIIPNSLPG
jgi:hypothetical protein